ncbi:hypothetical protein J5N97_002444 [Dioscorea zingiberensis]|uniref:Chromosome transmission fidelity protein 18 homolog n=1 Tax=Dioscorea zingiberensis TaxID=325984 RepID=A0A9D5D2U4_9LILI|nr:hypothetical protein J5N97_002444 [Dioscorea zingiberensis]
MDIPDPEELEWLESNSFYPEEEDGEEFIIPEDDEEVQEIPALEIRDPTSDTEVQVSRKRPLSVDDGVCNGDSGSKRRALEDEDWLRYSPPKHVVSDESTKADDPLVSVTEEIISRFASDIQGDCMPVTGPCGDRVYAKLSSGEKAGGQKLPHRGKPSNVLLSVPINVLMERLEQETFQKTLRECFDSPNCENQTVTHTVTEQLWVDKYAPNSFTELLSNEQTNREVLLWLKQWDSCVFGSQIRATADDVLTALHRHSSISQHENLSENKSFNRNRRVPFVNQSLKHSNVMDREDVNRKDISDAWNRKFIINQPPEQKVLLLCGPPGLGKTTLAHVAAKHCGYRVVEINASDDRSSSTIEAKILDVVQMDSVMADSKPKCLVIDEIDGALGEGKGAVEVILKMVNTEKKSNVEKGTVGQEVQPGKSSSKKGRKTATLLRPVICICNDLYAPALRQLRQVAKVHIFVQPTISRVVNRLKYICNREGFRTNSIALSALAEYTECDIRSCLNTLQFLNKKKVNLNVLDIGSQVVGRKDISRSSFDVWKEVFQKRKSKCGRKSLNDYNGLGHLDFLYSLIANRGDYELTMDGIHENFLQLSYHDPKMQKTARCLDMLGVSDSLLHYILRTQQMSLQAYQPPIAVSLSYLIAQVERPNIEWPKSIPRCRALLMENKDLLKSWQNKISPSISRHMSIESFVEDVVSPFLYILSPQTLRPVALHLLSEREKYDLAQLVDTMVSYSLTYKNSKPEPMQKLFKFGTSDDALVPSLDPPINNFVNFKDYQSEHSGLSVTMKQVLLHEVEKQRILRESIGKSTNSTEKSSNVNQTTSTLDAQVIPVVKTTTVSAENGSKTAAALTQTQKILSINPKPGSVPNKNLPVTGKNFKSPANRKRPSGNLTNFFDRVRKGDSTNSEDTGEVLHNAATTERDSRPLIFKYNEGFTNAVKRPVKVRELLL